MAEKPLATTIEEDVEPEALAEGDLVVTADEPDDGPAAPRVDDDQTRDAEDPREDPAALAPTSSAR